MGAPKKDEQKEKKLIDEIIKSTDIPKEAKQAEVALRQLVLLGMRENQLKAILQFENAKKTLQLR